MSYDLMYEEIIMNLLSEQLYYAYEERINELEFLIEELADYIKNEVEVNEYNKFIILKKVSQSLQINKSDDKWNVI